MTLRPSQAALAGNVGPGLSLARLRRPWPETSGGDSVGAASRPVPEVPAVAAAGGPDGAPGPAACSRSSAPLRKRSRPTWAMKATLTPSAMPSTPRLLSTCSPNQTPRNTQGRQFHRGYDEKDDQRPDAVVGIEHQVGPHHSGDGAAGAHQRRLRAGGYGPVAHGGHYSGSQVEDQVAPVTQAALDVVAENPQGRPCFPRSGTGPRG